MDSETIHANKVLLAVMDAIVTENAKKRDAAIKELEASGLSIEEFNAKHYRENGEIFPSFENSEMEIKAIIRKPGGFGVKQNISPERILELYQENLSLQDISKTLDRSEKWVRKKLSTFGIRFEEGGVRFNSSDIPFGWKEHSGKLVALGSEQWILEKIEQDLREKKSADEICRSLNELKIKPRLARKWIAQMLPKVLQTNKKLKSIIKPVI